MRAGEHHPVHGAAIGLGIVTLVAALVAGALYFVHDHRLDQEAARRRRETARGPRVTVAKVKKAPSIRKLDLPADVRAFTQATIYAKVAGYVKEMRVDKGDVVNKGDVLAVLESPEIDQQVVGARSDLVIKAATERRYAALVGSGVVSKQDYDAARSALGVAEAALRQAKAEQAYEVLRAPFDGTVTLRYVDVGALVPAGTGSTSGALPIVDLADLGTLRVAVFLLQDLAPYVHEGDAVTLTSDDQPDLHIDAHITRITRNLQVQSRAMLCEIWLTNTYRLYPGSFLHARMELKAPPRLIIPTNAVVVREGKTMAALVRDDKVHLVPIETGLDDGKTVQLRGGGLAEGDAIVLDLPGEVAEGARVQPTTSSTARR